MCPWKFLKLSVPPISFTDPFNFSGIGVEIKLIAPPVVKGPNLIWLEPFNIYIEFILPMVGK